MQAFYPEAYGVLEKKEINESVIEVNGMGVIRDGKVTFELLEGFGKDIKRSSSVEVAPSSAGNYSASVYSSFGKAGSELILRSLRAGVDTGNDQKTVATSAILRYEMTATFHVPAIEASVTVDTLQFYQYVKDILADGEALDGRYNGNLNLKDGVNDNFKNGVRVRGDILLTEDDINDVVSKAYLSHKGIDIHISDYSALSGTTENSIKNEILTSLIKVITGTIIPALFTPSPVPESSSATPSSDNGAPETEEEKEKRRYVAQLVHYKLYESETDINTETISFNFNQDSKIPLPLSANTTLLATVPKEYSDKIVTLIDLRTTEFIEKRVNITSDLNFNTDQIRSLEVEIKYDEPDVRFPSKRIDHDEFPFRTGQETYTFDYFLSKNGQGEFVEDYKYRTRISYVGRGYIDQNEGWSQWFKSQSGSLMVNFENSGFINVKCRMGDIDWSLIKMVTVEFNYPHVQGKTDTSGRLTFKEGEEEKNWSCYKYGMESNEYTYLVRYTNLDGSSYEAPMQTKTAKEINIDDLYEGAPLEADFLASYSPSLVSRIRAEVLYEDKALNISKKFTHWLDDREWHWSMNLRAGAVETFRYRYHVEYADGSFKDTDWSEPCGRNADIPVFSVTEPTSNTAKLQVNAMSLRNWENWDFAEVFVTYDDPENHLHEEFDTIFLTREHINETVEITCPAGSAKPFLCSANIYTLDGKVIPVPEQEMTRSFTLRKPEE